MDTEKKWREICPDFLASHVILPCFREDVEEDTIRSSQKFRRFFIKTSNLKILYIVNSSINSIFSLIHYNLFPFRKQLFYTLFIKTF